MNPRLVALTLVLALVAGPVAVSTPVAAFHHVCIKEPCHDSPQDLLCTTKWVKQVATALGACDEW